MANSLAKTYVSNAFLKIENANLYGIFAWSQKEADLIPQKSWLILLEIFVYEHSLEKAYQLFQQVRNNSLLIKKNEELEKYQQFLTEGIIQLGEGKITLFARGFRSFIEKDMLFELGEFSQNYYQVLPQLFQKIALEDDLLSIETFTDFIQVVENLEKMGFLSPAIAQINWGDLKRPMPICQAFGLTRGTPVDRYYLSQFIEKVYPQIQGNILEIGGTPKDKDFYQVNQGTSYKILNIEAGPGVDIVGDVHDPSIVEPESFDSIIIFNVLEHCYAPWIAVENIWKWLKPDGKCFAMVPSAIRVHATPQDYWRPLPDAFVYIFRNFSQQQLYVYGNPITAIAGYQGIATEELTQAELDAFHPDYPVATCMVAQK